MAAVGALALVSALAGCGPDEAASEISAPSSPTATTLVSTTAPVAPATLETATEQYEVVAGDTLHGIAERHCSTLDVLVSLNGWTDGARHAIFPADTMLVPTAECPAPSPAGTDQPITTVDAGGQIIDPGRYSSTLWGDPADYGAIYATPECTELRAAGNELTTETGSNVEDADPARQFLAAVAAMPNAPTPEVQAAIESTLAIYTQYAPVWNQVQLDARNGLEISNNPVWQAAVEVFSAGEAQRDLMWDYVDQECPSIGTSED